MNELKNFLKNTGEKIFIFLLVIVVGVVLVKVITTLLKKILIKSKMDHTVKTFLFSFTKVLLYAIVVIIALSTIGINVNSIVTALGAAAITAGLALQETLSNFVSGIIILFSKPFTAGDVLEYDGITGSVVSINVFYTTLKAINDRTVQIPNSKLTSSTVINRSFDGLIRMRMAYTVSYEDDIDKVKQVIYELISTSDSICTEPLPKVTVGNHLDSGLEIVVNVWLKVEDYYKVYYFMQEEVKKAFDKNGITIPYPHIVLKND